jgi:hypothetical protein
MPVGMCALCRNREGCRFRQPGTWVVECAMFEEGGPPRGGTAPPENVTEGLPPNDRSRQQQLGPSGA